MLGSAIYNEHSVTVFTAQIKKVTVTHVEEEHIVQHLIFFIDE